MPGRRWTPEEDRQLLNMLEAGLAAEDIAVRLERKLRTEIYSRVQRLARRPTSSNRRNFQPRPAEEEARARDENRTT